ncbi:MAG: glutaredoxin family protein [Opitutales bacterium]
MDTPKLYIKPGCPWCREAQTWLDKQGLKYDLRDITSNRDDFARMQQISGQTKTPTFEYGDFVVPDFDVAEFQAAVDEAPDIKAKLGLL